VIRPPSPHWDNGLTGNTNGAEVVVERRAIGGFNGWLSYAWSDSRVEDARRAGHLDESYPADFDQRHTVKRLSPIAGRGG
jgi:hypothetical protein